jgi:2-polyprenyl-3-methyl-5-hydroxy-6-metoxy-1,4-benzoquinol methylase
MRADPKPDIASATDDYAARFDGPGGRYLLQVQTDTMLSMLKPWPGAAVLDVGGGHGQICVPLARHGHRVTLLASDITGTWRVAKQAPGALSLLVANLLNPPIRDRSFDVVTCFRILAHVDDWQALVGQLCRLARDAVLIDFPVPSGANALTPWLFAVKRRLERTTRPYAMIRRSTMIACLRAHGFECRTVFPQFFFPMVLHRVIAHSGVSGTAERVFRQLGLTRAFGSPLILLAVRSGRGGSPRL